jgi:peptidoglycan/LPS O-acetylase OafA/YrhL
MNYRTEIDGIRAIAVLAVMIAHSGVGILPGGFAGVDVFFVISGYLISGIILRELERGKFSFGDFYARRARRIFPALFFMLLTVSLAAWMLLTPSELKDYSASTFFSLIFLSNAYFIDFTEYFAPSAHYIPLLHTWSLAIEEQFYLIFPVVALASFRLGGRRGLWIAVVVLLLASLALSEWGWRNKPAGNYFFSPSRFWEILLGAVVVFWSSRRVVVNNDVLAALGLASIIASFVIYDENTPFPSVYALLPTLGTALLLLFARQTGWVGRILSLRPLRLIGLISFSAYLWHQPVFAFARIHEIDPSSPRVAVILIICVLSLSFLSWKYVEQPFRTKPQDKKSFMLRRAITLSIAALGIATMSLVGHFSKLPLMRYSNADQKLVEMTREAAMGFQRHVGRAFESRAFLPIGQAPKVIFIGDSYARDFMNVLDARGYLSRIDASYWVIAGECAPYFQQSGDLRLNEVWNAPNCREYDRYRSPKMLETIEEADVVILASNWREGAAPFLAETVDNIRTLSLAPIVLVGPKSFGRIDIRSLLRLSMHERMEYRTKENAEISKLNQELSEIAGVTYVDVLGALCDPNGRCPQVTESGRLISQDGGHLTPAGAQLLSNRLDQGMELSVVLGLASD